MQISSSFRIHSSLFKLFGCRNTGIGCQGEIVARVVSSFVVLVMRCGLIHWERIKVASVFIFELLLFNCRDLML